ncbi:MAG: nitroreductase [Ruminococcaceae bacterium]|nr:nitroreductase [Oscillospiraceae bacterium]
MFKDLVIRNRSYRAFHEVCAIEKHELLDMIDTARYTPSSVNIQPFKYYLSHDKEGNAKIFPHTKWARLLKDYDGPADGERPSAYIIVCNDLKIAPNIDRFAVDAGIISQTIMIAAVEKGYGGCMIKNFVPEDLAADLQLPEHIRPFIILALGKPAEQIILDEIADGEKTSYYRDENNVHHVPKRRLADIIINK